MLQMNESIEQWTARMIETYGRAVIHVSDTMPFAYTVGLSGAARPRPELLMLGVANPESARHVLNRLVRAIEPNMADGAVIKVDPSAFYGAMLKHIDEPDDYPLNVVRAHYGRDHQFRVMQVVLPDQHGFYPGDWQCTPPYSAIPRLWEPVKRAEPIGRDAS